MYFHVSLLYNTVDVFEQAYSTERFDQLGINCRYPSGGCREVKWDTMVYGGQPLFSATRVFEPEPGYFHSIPVLQPSDNDYIRCLL